ncbi:alpha/beta-hydrolase [Meira miltonrushii]|uniref:Prolyl endopeptidase n=1 Tax=Meira miltonrushii TaxID=1280837 RepID=A0A316VIG6_9BASI|nr:alpha/beta-hydrolase [Meira miltonrushii]PWN36838.1 alpha/beta-hydrolase [Meira miltonrushii]
MQVRTIYALVALAVLNLVQCVSLNKRVQSNAPGWDPRSTPFPPVRRVDAVFQYRSEAAKGNVSVPDPYNWFEKSDASDFIQAQLAFTKTYLNKLEDLDAMRSAISAANFPKFRPPIASGPKDDPTYVYYFNEGGYSLGYLYVAKQKDLDEAAKTHYATFPGNVLIDESLLNGELLWLQQLSPDGTKLLYTTVDAKTYGNQKLFVRDVSSPLIDKSKPAQEGGYDRHPDKITDFQIGTETWSGDSKSFFYTASDTSIKYHVLGTDAKDDIVVVQPNKDNNGGWWVELSDDQKFLLLSGQSDIFDGSRFYVAALDQEISASMNWLCIAPDYTFDWDYATNVGNDFYFRTTKDAPNQQIVRFALDFTKAAKTDNGFNTFTHGADFVVVIPQRTDANLAHYITYDNDKILATYEKNDVSEFTAYSLKTGVSLQSLDLGILSTSTETHGYPPGIDVYMQASSLNTPAQLYHLRWNRGTSKFTSELVYQQKNKAIDPAKYTVERQWVSSKSGDVKIPIFVLYRKGLKLDGTHPVIINFYGAYGYILESSYDPQHMAFVRSYDAVYILAAPRGGGESGDDWHKAGQLQNKQNTFEDIISVAQFAIDQKWTSPGKVILDVESAGASAAAAIVNQAPEGLFGAFIGTRGLYDMLRSDQSSNKVARALEYGSPSDPKAFDWLRKYSPLQNIDPKKAYPTILLYPPQGDGGNGGEPWHTYKYVSELQHDLPNNPSPILLGNGTDTQDERSATAFALAAHTIGLKLVK